MGAVMWLGLPASWGFFLYVGVGSAGEDGPPLRGDAPLFPLSSAGPARNHEKCG